MKKAREPRAFFVPAAAYSRSALRALVEPEPEDEAIVLPPDEPLELAPAVEPEPIAPPELAPVEPAVLPAVLLPVLPAVLPAVLPVLPDVEPWAAAPLPGVPVVPIGVFWVLR